MHAHCTARNLMVDVVVGKEELKTTSSEEVIGCALRVGGAEGRPGGGGPPGYDEAEETAVAGSTGFSGPEVDGVGAGEHATGFGDYGSGYEGEDAGYQVECPRIVSFVFGYKGDVVGYL